MTSRKKKLLAIQLGLLFIGLLFFLFTYKLNFNQNEILTLENQKKVLENFDNKNQEKNEGNIFSNIEYSGFDLAGNRYILKAKSAVSKNSNENLIEMSGVNATFYFKDETILKIRSDYGEYNNSTLDIKFQKNIKAEYEKTSLEAQYAEYSNTEGFLNISDDVKINDIQGNLFADKLSFNVKDKMLEIKTFNDDRINVNVNTDEKRF
tara:strand:- start:5923 stop:6543 length:621 start_codon:yes stop_codon:yes gene_type:complete